MPYYYYNEKTSDLSETIENNLIFSRAPLVRTQHLAAAAQYINIDNKHCSGRSKRDGQIGEADKQRARRHDRHAHK